MQERQITRVEMRAKDFYTICSQRIEQKTSFEVHVSKLDAAAVEQAINAIQEMNEASKKRFFERLTKAVKMFTKTYRFPFFLGVFVNAQSARYDIFLVEESDEMWIIFNAP